LGRCALLGIASKLESAFETCGSTASYHCNHEVAMEDVRIGAPTRLLYEAPHLSVGDFVSSGHLGEAWQSAEHFHQSIQITILSRRSSLQADWLTVCGSKSCKRISGPAICVTPAFQPHSMEWEEARGSIMIMISPELLGEAVKNGGHSGFTAQERYGTCDPFLQHLGQLLICARDAGTPITRLYAESTAVIFLEHLARRVEPSPARTTSGCGRLPQVIEYIHANVDAELSIAELARIAQTSAFHFARQFKASTGVTPHQYVMERRIEMARRLLVDPHLSIAAVAYACGFATQAHLTTVFRRLVGETPKAYRNLVG
jgi:AraC family transcriptional regulator